MTSSDAGGRGWQSAKICAKELVWENRRRCMNNFRTCQHTLEWRQQAKSRRPGHWPAEKEEVDNFFPASDDQMRAFERRSNMRDSFLEVWKIDISWLRQGVHWRCRSCDALSLKFFFSSFPGSFAQDVLPLPLLRGVSLPPVNRLIVHGMQHVPPF